MKAVMVLLMLAVSLGAHGLEQIQAPTPVRNNPDLTETIWRAAVEPGGRYDLIGLHRIASPKVKPVAAVLYLPGTNMNGEIAITDERHNLWLWLARRGVVVYTLDYRTHFVPNEPVPLDTTFMKDWTIERFVQDAALAFDHARKEAVPVFVAGFSRGASYAWMLAGIRPAAGLIALDGSFKQFSVTATTTFDRQAALEVLAARGEYASVLSRSRGWASRTEMMERAATDPSGPAMDESDSIGKQLESTLYNAWGEGGLANPVDGVSRIDILARAMVGYDRTFPAIQDIEGRAIASTLDDPATALDDHFGDMTLPIIWFGATGLGPNHLLNGIWSVANSGSGDVTIHVLENHGHLDVLYGEAAADDVFDEIRHWIEGVLE